MENYFYQVVVLHDTKIQIWKQFTTFSSSSSFAYCCITRYKDTNLKAIHNSQKHFTELDWLYYTIQRYKFESNSQHRQALCPSGWGCITRYKDTNLKAIHNSLRPSTTDWRVVLHDTKIQIWKQFTTSPSGVSALFSCITRYKDTNLKAIHNPNFS